MELMLLVPYPQRYKPILSYLLVMLQHLTYLLVGLGVGAPHPTKKVVVHSRGSAPVRDAIIFAGPNPRVSGDAFQLRSSGFSP